MIIKTNMKIKIVRLYETPETNPKQTEGLLYVIDNDKIIFECKTLELPWKDNHFQVSCIPAGIYTAKKRLTKYSHFKYEHFHILDVKNRDNVLIHGGNYYTDILGCILVGKEYIDMNNDGIRDVTSSRNTLRKILSLVKTDEIELEIKYKE